MGVIVILAFAHQLASSMDDGSSESVIDVDSGKKSLSVVSNSELVCGSCGEHFGLPTLETCHRNYFHCNKSSSDLGFFSEK